MCMVGMDQVSDPHHTNMFVMFVMKLLHVIPWEQYVKLLWRMAHTLTQAHEEFVGDQWPEKSHQPKVKESRHEPEKIEIKYVREALLPRRDFSIVDNW